MDSSNALRSLRAAFPHATPPQWLWTWNGECFGYRRDHSLFTHDGVEVGRFVGLEVFGVDGQYLGELKRTTDGERLITGSYKKARRSPPFVPTLVNAAQRLEARRPQTMYCGHEEFPSPEALKTAVFEWKSRLKKFTNA